MSSLYTGIYIDSKKSIVDEGIEIFSLQDHIKTSLFSVPFYDSLKLALKEHNEGNHSEAVRIYSELSEKGSKLACYNLGNCYLFGKGVEKDTDKFVEYWERGGHIHPNQLRLFRLLSNISLFSDSSPEPTCLFILTHSLLHINSFSRHLF